MTTTIKPSESINILLDICSKGCIISNIKAAPIGSEKYTEILFGSDIKYFFPKQMIPNKLPPIIDAVISIKGIGMSHTLSIMLNLSVDEYINWYPTILYPNLSIYKDLSDSDYNENIDKIMYFLYTKHISSKINYYRIPKTNSQSASQIENRKKNFWNYMYNGCFGKIGVLYLSICNKYLIPDVNKLIINNILTIEKWSNLGFYCV